jgi:DNA-binding IclR family transcriptional regulator
MVRAMSYELSILRAMLRLARRREEANVDALVVRAGGTRAEARGALQRLERAGLAVRRDEARARLTMTGFALAVATLPARAPMARVGQRVRAA